MRADKIDLKMYEGATFNHKFRWKTKTAEGVTVPVDLIGYRAMMHIRERIGDKDPLFMLSVDNGRVLIPDQSIEDNKGIYELKIEDEDTFGICTEHKNIKAIYDLFFFLGDQLSATEVSFQPQVPIELV